MATEAGLPDHSVKDTPYTLTVKMHDREVEIPVTVCYTCGVLVWEEEYHQRWARDQHRKIAAAHLGMG